jgi:4-amino-4-deoxy-L-arabinose transferase-like glycosyltransferase
MSELAEREATNSFAGAKQPCDATGPYWRWSFIALLIIATALRIYLAGRSGLRPDELFSLAMATGHSLEHPAAIADPKLGDFAEPNQAVPIREFRRYLKHDDPPASPARVIRAVLLSDTSPPLYYLLLYGWTLIFGASDIALRLFSTACSLACLPLLGMIARRVAGPAAVSAVYVLFAFSPLAIYYSAEGRMYSLLWLCVLATTWVSLAMRQRGGGAGLFALWVLTSAAGLLTHYFFVFPWLAIVGYLLIRPARLERHQLALCVLATALLILPWYVRVPESLAGWRITKDWLKSRPLHFSRLVALRDNVLQFFYGHDRRLWLGRRVWNMPPLLLFAAIAVLMLWRMRARIFARGRLLLGLIFLAGCMGPFVFDRLQHTYTIGLPRYTISVLPVAYLLAAAGLSSLTRRARIGMVCLIVLAWAPNLLIMNRDPSHWFAIREISRTASGNGTSTDLILVHSIPSGVLGVARYAEGPARMASWVGQLGTRQMPESLRQLASGRTRILFVKLHEVGEPAPEEDWLRANATTFSERRFELAEVVDFRPRLSETF